MNNNEKGAPNAQNIKPLQFEIEGKIFETTDQYKTGAELKQLAGIPLDVELFLKIARPYKDELIENDNRVNLARPEIEKFYVKEVYEFILDGKKFRSFKKIVTGEEIFQLAGTTSDCVWLYQKLKDGDFERISLDEEVDLSNKGVENFVTKEPEIFDYTVDDEPETTAQKFLTPNQILELAGLTPIENYYLIEKKPDGSQVNYKDRADEKIKMRCPALHFVSIYNGEVNVS